MCMTVSSSTLVAQDAVEVKIYCASYNASIHSCVA